MTFVELTENNKYEIFTEYPHVIRKKGSEVVCKQSLNNCGYVQVSIDGVTKPFHQVIAKQFIPNDDPNVKTDVNHINENRLDNRIENLEWISHSDNLKHRRKYQRQKAEYVTELDLTNLYQIESYNGHDFDRYYFDAESETLYIYTRHKYKIVKPSFNGKIIVLMTEDGRNLTKSYNKTLKQLKAIYT